MQNNQHNNYAPQNGYIFYDYETFGADPKKSMPAQFGALITDLDLNIIEKIQFYCKPQKNQIPAPISVLVTGITPQDCVQEGFSEPEFAAKINKILSQAGYCIIGYNNFSFDDELTRFLFYRNFEMPYNWHFDQGNSRRDLYEFIRLVYALRPETLNWHYNLDDNGNKKVSLKLTDITSVNNIAHEHAHEALSDAIATYELFKLIKKNNPKLFDFAEKIHRTKDFRSYFNLIQQQAKPLINISPFYGLDNSNLAVVLPLISDNNTTVVCDLSVDLDAWINLDSDQLRQRLFAKKEELGELSRPPLQQVKFNRVPLLLQQNLLREQDLERLNLDFTKINDNFIRLQQLLQLSDFRQKLVAVFCPENHSESNAESNEIEFLDIASSLYKFNFFKTDFKSFATKIRRQTVIDSEDLAKLRGGSNSDELNLLFDYYLYQNYPTNLDPKDLAQFDQITATDFVQKWEEFCQELTQVLSSENPYELTEEQRQNLQLTCEYITKLPLYSSLTKDVRENQCFVQFINQAKI